MATPTEILEQLIADSTSQIIDLNAQIAQVQGLIDGFEEKKEGIRDGLMTPAANDLTNYLENVKAPQFASSWGGEVDVVFGATYNNTTPDGNISSATLTDWRIIDTTNSNTLYEYLGTGWDGDSNITDWISDWNFGKDYLIRPLTDFVGTYGVLPNINALGIAISQLEGSRDKIQQSQDVFGRYV